MNKLKMWQKDWDEAEKCWDQRALETANEYPLKGLKKLPDMVGIAPETAKNLKWKSLKWMILQDHQKEVLRGFLKHPIKYGKAFLKSLVKKSSFAREGDFFFYGIETMDEFQELLVDPSSIFVLGFSYCHKPFECPSGRFTSDCMHDENSAVCRQCFIGKTMHAVKDESVIPLIIPTVHYIGGKIFEIVHQHPTQQVIFMITACEMTLNMFGDWGNMAGIKGIGVRLDGRICNTMKAFELSEQGIKPGLTVVLDETQRKMLDLLRLRTKQTRENLRQTNLEQS